MARLASMKSRRWRCGTYHGVCTLAARHLQKLDVLGARSSRPVEREVVDPGGVALVRSVESARPRPRRWNVVVL